MKAAAAILAAVVLAANLAVHTRTSILPAAAAGCSPVPAGEGDNSGKLAAANNGFGFRLLQALLGRGQHNVFISPTSAAVALEMTYDGARGSTQTAMAKTLGLQGMTRAQVRQQAAGLLSTLASGDPRVELAVANSLWARQGVPFNAGFLQDARRYYAAQVQALDFNSPGAAAAINGWVSCATKGKIKTMVSPPIPDTMVLYLLNAVYFHGLWGTPFDAKATHPHLFTAASGKRIQVPMMNRRGEIAYYQEPQYTGPSTPAPRFQMASLPYGSGRFSMILVLPARGQRLPAFARQLSAHFASWVTHLGSPGELQLALPRFKLDQAFKLNAQLQRLGMKVAFDPSTANFSGMCSRCPPLYISEVKQKTYLSVDEKGTEATAATGVGVGTAAIPPPIPLMIVDHPFFLAIRDQQTGAILFLGLITNPAS